MACELNKQASKRHFRKVVGMQIAMVFCIFLQLLSILFLTLIFVESNLVMAYYLLNCFVILTFLLLFLGLYTPLFEPVLKNNSFKIKPAINLPIELEQANIEGVSIEIPELKMEGLPQSTDQSYQECTSTSETAPSIGSPSSPTV